jgi:hypothetical protein
MTKKRDKPLHLDLSFDEALKRVAQTDPRELPREKKAKSKKRKRSSRPISKTSASPKPPVPSSK